MSDTFNSVENPAFTYKLSKPIKFAGVELEELAVRAPTILDMKGLGNPVKMNPFREGADPEIDYDIAFKMLSKLTGVPETGINSMDINDVMVCFWGLVPFFVPR